MDDENEVTAKSSSMIPRSRVNTDISFILFVCYSVLICNLLAVVLLTPMVLGFVVYAVRPHEAVDGWDFPEPILNSLFRTVALAILLVSIPIQAVGASIGLANSSHLQFRYCAVAFLIAAIDLALLTVHGVPK